MRRGNRKLRPRHRAERALLCALEPSTLRFISPRVRILVVTGVTLVLASVLVHRSTTLWRHARGIERRIAHRHAHFLQEAHADHFQRGNIHTHSLRSDGTAPLEDVVAWYRTNGYQFLAMTEHNIRIDPAELDTFAAPGFVVIPGEEVTDKWSGTPLHVNALCAKGEIRGGFDFPRADEGLARIVEDIRALGGTPLVNHPNFHWSLTADDIARGVHGRYLLEIWSGHPDVSPAGDRSHPSAEAIWDNLLARGAEAIPVAVDDAHGLPGNPRSDALPGRGWVETFGDETTTKAICEALEDGRLYASNGPAIARLAVGGDTFVVATADSQAVVTFVGEEGETLAEMRAADAPTQEVTYRLTGGETLVRARVTDAEGRHAWTAAYRVGG